MFERATVLGGGSFGTALAYLLAQKGRDVRLWCRRAEVAEAINRDHHNPAHLEDLDLPREIRANSDPAAALDGAELVLQVCPSHTVREVMTRLAPHLRDEMVVVSASKGIEVDTLMLMSDVLEEVLGRDRSSRLCYLSGPSFAAEIVRKVPTAICLASRDHELADHVRDALSTPFLRVYSTDDVRGVELGGALKNVIAIATGIADGLELGLNARAAIITRGLAEISRLAAVMGANPLTLMGLAGIGDLILTCTGALSRNRSVGMELGKGRSMDEILAGMNEVAEGVRTTKSVWSLARRHKVDMPICETIYRIIYGGMSPALAIEDLMTRAQRRERE